METFTDTVQLARGIYLQASEQRFRLHRLLPWEEAPFDEAMREIGDPAVTRQLMAGAFYAGFSRRVENESKDFGATAPSVLRYIFTLAVSYQTTHATPPTMRRVAERLAARGSHTAAAHCLNVAEEESGHDNLALMDLMALGLPAQEFVARVQPKSALALVERFSRYAESDAPIAVLGYAYALERMSLFITEASIAAIERLLPAGIKATRCLRIHSATGSDIGHVAESVALMSTLPPEDRAVIARATYETISSQFAVPVDYPGDETMCALLGEFGWSFDGTGLESQFACCGQDGKPQYSQRIAFKSK